MKICFIAHLNDLSGANRSLVDLIFQLRNDNEITVIIPRKGELSEFLEKNGIPFKTILSGMWVYSNTEKKIKIISKLLINILAEVNFFSYFLFNKFDIVHFNSSTYGCGAKSLSLLKQKYTWHIRELAEETFSLKFFNKKKSLKLINNSEKVIVISEFISQHIKNEVDINKVEIIYNGIKIPSKKEINKVSINGLLFVGAINYDKGQLVALQAMNYLLKKNGTVLPITFLGKVTNFHYMKRIEKYIDQNELNPYVTFKGYKQDISRYRTPDKIVLICSEQEAFGRVTIEAMANQEIVIGNNAGATPEIIIDGKYGYLYDGGHIDLAEKIDMVTKNKINDKMINESYEYVEKHFSIKKTANMIERLFENITRIKR